jgi:CBS domain-containing protein
MDKVRDVLAVKGTQVWEIGPNATVLEALRLMAAKDVGALLVTEHGEPVGIFSERDHVRRVAQTGKASEDVAVREVLTQKVLCVPPDRTIQECMAIMTEKHVRHLPVVDDGKVVGMVSIGDIVKAVVSQQKFIIGQLESYIVGG